MYFCQMLHNIIESLRTLASHFQRLFYFGENENSYRFVLFYGHLSMETAGYQEVTQLIELN